MASADDVLRKLRAREKRDASRMRAEMREMLFDRKRALSFHERAQSLPHPHQELRPLTIRTPGIGTRLGMFFLPLTLANPRNRSRGKHAAWIHAQHRKKVIDALSDQRIAPWNLLLMNAQLPLQGRTMIRCIRYTSGVTDATAGWSKVPIDCMQPGGFRRGKSFSGLGIIASDSPKHTDVIEWCEPSRSGEGFAVFEIWTGG